MTSDQVALFVKYGACGLMIDGTHKISNVEPVTEGKKKARANADDGDPSKSYTGMMLTTASVLCSDSRWRPVVQVLSDLKDVETLRPLFVVLAAHSKGEWFPRTCVALS